MRILAMILGILGGVIALEGTSLTLKATGIGNVFGVTHSGHAFWLSTLALLCAVIGIIGAALTLSRPVWGGILMILAAIGGTLAITGGFLIGGIVLIIAGVLAFMSARQPALSPTPART